MPKAPEQIAVEIVEHDLPDEMRDSFMPYALSVTTARAIPDARDGLKPVQRRILHVMHQLRLNPQSGHRKSAGICGEVMGKYHPHGDSAIYEAMVRMGQSVSTNVPLVDPRGNFGSLDDPPAAYRYTEARMSVAATVMLDGINEDAVDFVDTFDGERSEPTVLPAGLPNLLVNGASGIAVGMATSIPPHNITETVAAVKKWLKHKAVKPLTSADLLKLMPGPDFPCGGILIATPEMLKEAYTTGRGSFRLRARCKVEPITAQRSRLIFTELPYMTGAVRVVEGIRKAQNDDKLAGVSDAIDMTDKHGAKVIVDLQSGANIQAIEEALYASTPLEESVSLNAVALLEGQPLQMSLYQMVSAYGEHVLTTTRRRAEYVRDAAESDAHILRGLIKATASIDEVIRIIRKAQDAAEAKKQLVKSLQIDENQAESILNMQLRSLSSLEEIELKRRLKIKEDIVKDRTAVLSDDDLLRSECVSNLDKYTASLKAPRRTVIVDSAQASVPKSALPSVVATMGTNGSISVASKRSTKSGTLTQVFAESGTALAINRDARVETLTVESKPKGRNYVGVLSGDHPVLIVADSGRICRVAPDYALGGGSVSGLRTGEQIAAACDAPDGAEVIVVSSDGKCLRTSVDNYMVGQKSRFIDSFKLAEGERIVLAQPTTPKTVLATLQDDETLKGTAVKDIPLKGRVGAGVRLLPSGSTQKIVAAVASEAPTATRKRARKPSTVPVTPRARKAAGSYAAVSFS